MTQLTFDMVVLGAGTAGSVVAGRLADAGHSVALVEAGPDSLHHVHTEDTGGGLAQVSDPVRMHELWNGPLDWGYRSVPQQHASGRRLHLPRGKVVGGSHALNAMIWVRGHPMDFAAWADAGNPQWDWAHVQAAYDLLETDTRHPLRLLTTFDPLPIQASIVDAAVAAGIPFNSDYNNGICDGVSYMHYTVHEQHREMTSDVFLPTEHRAARARAGRVTVLAGHLADRLLIERGRCVGARLIEQRTGEVVEVHAGAEVVTSLGAFGSPSLLQRSGIGDPDELRAVGVPIRHELPAVGAGLADHWLVPVVYAVDRVLQPPVGVPVAQSHLFWRSRPELEVPDLQPIHFASPLVPDGVAPPAHGFSLMAGLVRPASRGRVTIDSPDPAAPPGIDPAVLSAPQDLTALVEAVRLCRRIGRQPALAGSWSARPVSPASTVPDDTRDLERYIRDTVVTYHHAAGTCAMRPEGVVDQNLRVHGIDGLRVADASIMPTIVSGNTNAPSAMIGWRAADFICETTDPTPETRREARL